MVVIVGDNGTLGSAVKCRSIPRAPRAPPTRPASGCRWSSPARWCKQPDRIVSHMVNIADLFELFGEIAGIDVPRAVPRPIDAVAMLPYLTNPAQRQHPHAGTSPRSAPNLQANGAINGPCRSSQHLHADPGDQERLRGQRRRLVGRRRHDPLTAGIPADGLQYCCDVNAFRANQGQPGYTIQPLDSVAIRNDRYKIVRTTSRATTPRRTRASR